MTEGIGSSFAANALRSLNAGQRPQFNGQAPPPPPGAAGDQFSTGPVAQLFQARESLDAAGQAELDSYMQNAFEQLQEGSFDAATAAEGAPQALKDYASENGLDLEGLFTEFKNGFDQFQARLDSAQYDASGGLDADYQNAADKALLDLLKPREKEANS